MRYIDSSVGQPEQSVAAWMQAALAEGVDGFHCQAGYFTLEGASLLVPVLRQCAADGASIRLLLGANHGATLASHVSYLVGLLDLPRTHVALGVVSFDDALFHPKVYHVTRADGSQTAYVGSANLTGPGITGRNIEAGIVLDSRLGDDADVLRHIVEHIERWFGEELPGLARISCVGDIDALLARRVLAQQGQRDLHTSEDETSGGSISTRSGLTRKALFKLPSLPPHIGEASFEGVSSLAVSRSTEESISRRFLRATEASFHFPQGVHIGHLLVILRLFSGNRTGTAFDDEFIRLNGSLGEGRIAGYRRQVKYKMLAAIELGLLSDIRLLTESEQYSPVLTEVGLRLLAKISPFFDEEAFILAPGVLSTTMPQSAAYYNQFMRNAQALDSDVRLIWRSIVLQMPAVRLMVAFLFKFGRRNIIKNDIYQNFFNYPPVIAFCDRMGIEPQTVASAQHRLPFLLNLLDSCGLLEQRISSVSLSSEPPHELRVIFEEIING